MDEINDKIIQELEEKIEIQAKMIEELSKESLLRKLGTIKERSGNK